MKHGFKNLSWTAAVAWLLLTVLAFGDTLPVFPGAEGWGAGTLAGRGGRVIIVDNLNDTGKGSFRAALRARGPRIIVFRVSGVIKLQKKEAKNRYIDLKEDNSLFLRGWTNVARRHYRNGVSQGHYRVLQEERARLRVPPHAFSCGYAEKQGY